MADWNAIIKQGRASGMLGTLYYILADNNIFSKVPERPRLHLLSSRTVADRQTDKVNWEVQNIHRTLGRAGIPVIILKGAAYSFSNLSPSKGRMFGDIDIMVPHGALSDTENQLKRNGWLATHHSEYDDKYYRRWMHEIPPLIHRSRQTVLDIHHNILPLTANLKPQSKDLWDKAISIDGYEDLYLLSKPDMILHSATHLFQEGEFERGLRNLFDIAKLIEQFRQEDNFWENLFERANTLDLVSPLLYALRYTHKILDISIPALNELTNGKKLPSESRLRLMDKLFLNALYPIESSKSHSLQSITNWMLFVRGHYLKMPIHLLIPHLIYKATFAKRDEEKASTQKEATDNLLRNFLDV